MRRRSRARVLRALSDFAPVCTARMYVGGGIGKLSTPGRAVTVDPERLARRVQEHVARRFLGSTHVRARGFWEGQGEPSVVVDLLHPLEAGAKCDTFRRKVQCTAGAIAKDLVQDAVAVVTVDAQGNQAVDFVPNSYPTDSKVCGRIDAKAAGDAIRRIRLG